MLTKKTETSTIIHFYISISCRFLGSTFLTLSGWTSSTRLLLLLFLLNCFQVLVAGVKETVGMISNVVRHSSWVHSLEQSQASDLMKVLSALVNYSFHLLLLQAIGAQQLLQVVLRESLEGTSVKLVLSGGCLVEHFITAPRLVVLLLALFAKHMSDVVAVGLLKFVRVHLLRELLLPEGVSLVHGEPQTFDEET